MQQRETKRYAVCVRDRAILIVDAVSIDEALARAYQVVEAVEQMQTADPFSIRLLPDDEPARVTYLRDGYFQLLAETSSTKH